MSYSFGARSRKRMIGVHPDLVKVMELAIMRSPVDFTVLEGLRTEERQRDLVNSGASQTMNSRHLTGHAIDIAPLDNGQVSWAWPLYHQLAPVVKKAAADLGVELEWGGDWRTSRTGRTGSCLGTNTPRTIWNHALRHSQAQTRRAPFRFLPPCHFLNECCSFLD